MIEAEKLSVKYQSDDETFTAVKNIDLTIPTGGTCVIIGPSGCGKSTLLKVFAGLIKEYDGEVRINGQPVDPRQQTIGFMPQNYGLLPWKNVYENICLGRKIKNPHEKIDRNSVQALMRRLGIEGLDKRYPNELSGGQQQRVALARSFSLRPDVLLMDEPFSALDAITREEMQDAFLSLWKEFAVSTVMVTHYVDEALYLGQRIVIMAANPGRITQIIDNPLFGGREIRKQPEFFNMGLRLRQLIKQEWKKEPLWENV